MASAVRNGSTPATVTATETWTPTSGARQAFAAAASVTVTFPAGGLRGFGAPGHRGPLICPLLMTEVCSRQGRRPAFRAVAQLPQLSSPQAPPRCSIDSAHGSGRPVEDARSRRGSCCLVERWEVERFLTDLRSLDLCGRRRGCGRPCEDFQVRSPYPPHRGVAGRGCAVAARGRPLPTRAAAPVVETERAVAGRYADVTLVLALTGLRLGELRGLRVRDVSSVPYPGLVGKRSVPQSDRVRPIVEEWAAGREANQLLFPAPEGGYLHAVGALVDDGSRSAPSRPAAHRCESVDCRWCRHQDGVGVAGSLDGETDARHLRPPDGDRRRPGGPGACEPGSRGPAGGPGVSERTHKSGERAKVASDLRKRGGAPGQIRTADTRFRRAVLYPLSYEGGAGSAPQEG